MLEGLNDVEELYGGQAERWKAKDSLCTRNWVLFVWHVAVKIDGETT
jgi:hypothetical protein